MNSLDWKFYVGFLIGLGILFVDTILCFLMLYSGHLGYWQFLEDPFAIETTLIIFIVFLVGIGFIILSYFIRSFKRDV